MYTLKDLLYFSSVNLSLKEVLVLEIIKTLPSPTRIYNILSFKGLNLKERQLRNILTSLEEANFFVRFRYNEGFLFAFPYIRVKKRLKRPNTKYKTCNIMPVSDKKQPVTYNPKINQPANLYTSGYLYNIYIYNRRNVNVISKSNNKNIYDDEYMCNNVYNKTYLNNNNHDFVVNKNNFSIVSSLKQKFKTDFPTKNAYITCDIPQNFDYSLLKEKILESKFLKDKDNLGFSWMIKHYDAIINDCYKTFNKPTKEVQTADFSQRTYSKEFLDSLFDSLSE